MKSSATRSGNNTKVSLPEQFRLAELTWARVAVVGEGQLAFGLCQSLGELGLQILRLDSLAELESALAESGTRKPEVVVGALEASSYTELRDIGARASALSIPSAFVAIEDSYVAVGPVVIPGVHADFLSSRAAMWALLHGGWSGQKLDTMLAGFSVGTCDEVEPWMVGAAYDQAARAVLAILTHAFRRTTTTTLIQQTGFRVVEFPLPAARTMGTGTWRKGVDGSAMGFIVGSQRSGTTMLGNHLSRHYDVAYFDEAQAYPCLSAFGPHGKTDFSIFKIPRWTSSWQFLGHHYPKAKYIFLKRPILQVTASMLSLRGFDGRSWAQHFGMQECRSAIFSWPIEDVIPGLQQELGECDEPFKVAAFCAFLKSAYESIYLKSGLQVLRLDYDRLVQDPDAVQEVAVFFGLRKREVNTIEQRGTLLIGQTDPARAIDTSSRSRYRDVLSEDQIARILSMEERWARLLESSGTGHVPLTPNSNRTELCTTLAVFPK